MQVDLLRQIVPNGARIGTVDKFQGQEAAVVLISMATSSSEDMPRKIEFLFSRNRLNVAISRARCPAVIFANPRLLENPLFKHRINAACQLVMLRKSICRPLEPWRRSNRKLPRKLGKPAAQ